MESKQIKPSEQVRRAILRSSKSRYRIGIEASVEQSALSRFVNGKRSITLTTLDKLADVLGLEITIREKDR